MDKPEFQHIYYDPDTVRWGHGNDAVGLQVLARIKIGEPTPEMDAAEKKKYEEAKAIYDKYINRGQRFKPAGKTANTKITAKITHINYEKQTVAWKQDNLTDADEVLGYKPAKGKWLINSMIALFKGKEIEFIN